MTTMHPYTNVTDWIAAFDTVLRAPPDGSALALAEQYLVFLGAEHDALTRARAWNMVGCAHHLAGDFHSALASYKSALALVDHADASTDAVRCLALLMINVGEAWCDLGDCLAAYAELSKAVALIQRTAPTYETPQLLGKAYQLLATAEPAEAEGWLLASAAVLHGKGFDAMLAETLIGIHSLQLRREEFDPAMALLRQICSLVEVMDAARAAALLGQIQYHHQPLVTLAEPPTAYLGTSLRRDDPDLAARMHWAVSWLEELGQVDQADALRAWADLTATTE